MSRNRSYKTLLQEVQELRDKSDKQEIIVKKLDRFQKAYADFIGDSKQNIGILVEQACKIFAGSCSLYNRFNKRTKTLSAFSSSNLPDNFIKENFAMGHVCYEETLKKNNGPVIFENLEATPYAITDPNVQRHRFKSYIGCPVTLENEVKGALCVYDVRQRAFNLTDLSIISNLAKLLSLEEQRLETEKALIKKIAYEKMVADISTRAINVDDTISFLDECLSIMGSALNVGGIFFWEYDAGSDTLSNISEWIMDGVSSKKDHLQNIPAKSLSWSFQLLTNNEVINFYDVEDCPDGEEKEIMRLLQIKSVLIVPLFIKNDFYGILGFEEYDHHRKWTKEDIKILRTASQIITKAVEGKRTEEERERLMSAIEQAAETIVVTDREGTIQYINPAFDRITGYTREEVIGQNPRILKSGKQDDAFYKELWDTITRGEVWSGRFINKKKDGTFYTEDATISPVHDATGKIVNYVAVKRDVTHEIKLEEQLRQAQKMEAVGTLAGGIAHDFNNLLMAIQGIASLMLYDVDSTHPHYERLQLITKQVRRGANLTAQLLGYARKGKYEVKPINLTRIVEETSDTFGRIHKEITIHRKLTEDLSSIEADQSQIEQILLNLYINASGAMPGGGTLILKTMNVTHKDMKGNLYDPRPGSYVLLAVTDTGIGMDKETMERIFEPFFTTKEMGRGTGLGLASAYGIIKGHRGYIHVESEKGRGTTFSIYLPTSDKKVETVVKPAKHVIEGSGTILLIDDEASVLNVGVRMLEVLGYTVLEAKSGRKAIETYKANKDTIDLVILDMIMPDMGGGEIYDRMKEISPDVKVLLSSGYSIEGQATEILEQGCDGFIQKPFDMAELSGKIRGFLDKE